MSHPTKWLLKSIENLEFERKKNNGEEGDKKDVSHIWKPPFFYPCDMESYRRKQKYVTDSWWLSCSPFFGRTTTSTEAWTNTYSHTSKLGTTTIRTCTCKIHQEAFGCSAGSIVHRMSKHNATRNSARHRPTKTYRSSSSIFSRQHASGWLCSHYASAAFWVDYQARISMLHAEYSGYICACVRICTRMYVFMRAWVSVCTYINTHKHIHRLRTSWSPLDLEGKRQKRLLH